MNGTKDWLLLYKQMDACNEKVDVLKIPFWPFLGGEQGEYFFHFFSNTLYLLIETSPWSY